MEGPFIGLCIKLELHAVDMARQTYFKTTHVTRSQATAVTAVRRCHELRLLRCVTSPSSGPHPYPLHPPLLFALYGAKGRLSIPVEYKYITALNIISVHVQVAADNVSGNVS